MLAILADVTMLAKMYALYFSLLQYWQMWKSLQACMHCISVYHTNKPRQSKWLFNPQYICDAVRQYGVALNGANWLKQMIWGRSTRWLWWFCQYGLSFQVEELSSTCLKVSRTSLASVPVPPPISIISNLSCLPVSNSCSRKVAMARP